MFQDLSIVGRRLLSCALVIAVPVRSGASPPVSTRVLLNDSIVRVPADAPRLVPHVVRIALTAEELAAQMDFVVSLRMRNFADLESRVQDGQRVSQAEMEVRYLPLEADFARTTSWLTSQGFSLTLEDKNHTNIFVRGSVARITDALGVTFARVVTGDGEFTSAVTAPSIPGDISNILLGITGLEPHILMHTPKVQNAGNEVGGYATPADVLAAYRAPSGSDVDGQPIIGSGQTVAVIMDATPLSSDLSTFWQVTGTNDTLGNYTLINVDGGPSTTSQSNDANEVTLDTEWVSGMAPGAKLRLYAVPTLSLYSLLAAWTQILDDGVVNVVSISAAIAEDDVSSAALQTASQTAAQMVAGGITILAGSGDGGSNPNPTTGPNGYNVSNPLTVSYPASDPSVTGVGGTTTTFNVDWIATSETAWSQMGSVATNPLASGGGISDYFTRPSWQVGSGVPSGTMRCVPDVAAMAEANPPAGGGTGGFVVRNGQETSFVGTSLSTPIWAGVVAMINQFRASAGIPNIGLLNRWTYSLIGTNALNDTTIGNNGAYYAGAGYDLCTGVGSPNIAQVIASTTQEISAVRAPASPVNAGSAVTMSATPQYQASTYQWQLNGINIPGATGSAYSIAAASTADNGTYTVVITSTLEGSLTYNIGTLTVNATSSTTSNAARLINISTRAQVGTGANILIPGFVIGGSGTETLLIRADGPSLTAFGVSGALSQPSLMVTNSTGTVMASNTGWGTNTNPAQIASTAASVGAFALAPGSADCAVIVSLPPGAYTVLVSGVGNTIGVALAEVYEVTSNGTRLINISTRAQVGTGANILIPGFVIGGSGTEELIVRADGPSLTQFGITGVLAQPSLSLTNSTGAVVGSNTGWGTNFYPTLIASTSASVGAFALVSGSSDSAAIVTLTPGAYTMQVDGVNNTTGVALAEVYEVPNN